MKKYIITIVLTIAVLSATSQVYNATEYRVNGKKAIADSVYKPISKLSSNIGSYLPLAGGTMTGKMSAKGIHLSDSLYCDYATSVGYYSSTPSWNHAKSIIQFVDGFMAMGFQTSSGAGGFMRIGNQGSSWFFDPVATNTWDVGSSGNKFRDGYFAGRVAATKHQATATDTTGVGSTAAVGTIMYYNGHFYGLIAGTPPAWKKMDQP